MMSFSNICMSEWRNWRRKARQKEVENGEVKPDLNTHNGVNKYNKVKYPRTCLEEEEEFHGPYSRSQASHLLQNPEWDGSKQNRSYQEKLTIKHVHKPLRGEVCSRKLLKTSQDFSAQLLRISSSKLLSDKRPNKWQARVHGIELVPSRVRDPFL